MQCLSIIFPLSRAYVAAMIHRPQASTAFPSAATSADARWTTPLSDGLPAPNV